MNNARKRDKEKKKSQLSLDKWTYLYLFLSRNISGGIYKQLHFLFKKGGGGTEIKTIKGSINLKKIFFSLF